LHVRVSSPITAVPNLNPYCLFGQSVAPATVNDGKDSARVEECFAWEQLEDNGGSSGGALWTFVLPGGLIFVNATWAVWPTDSLFVATAGSGEITGGTGIYADAHGRATLSGRWNVVTDYYRLVWTVHLI
jgi:hypothetical protein